MEGFVAHKICRVVMGLSLDDIADAVVLSMVGQFRRNFASLDHPAAGQGENKVPEDAKDRIAYGNDVFGVTVGQGLKSVNCLIKII